MLNKFIIQKNKSIKDAMIKIEKNGLGTLFVLNNKKLIGVVTDGDIRRVIISGKKIDEKIDKVMNKNFIKIKDNFSRNKILSIISKYGHKVRIYPILNKSGNLIDISTKERLTIIPVYSPYLQGNEARYLSECISTNWISSRGGYVNKFENHFSLLHNGRKSLAISSGTAGLHLAIKSLGIKESDEVIIPNFTFAAVINSILYERAKPVIVDVDKKKWTIDINEIKKNITKKTKAIIAVHLYGNPCDLDNLKKICKKNKIFLIEDCAEAIGSKYKNKLVGTFGDCAIFSFFANKTISTGEGGMIIFKEKKYFNRAKMLRDHGMQDTKKYYHNEVGFNYRMTNLQAAIGVAQLEKFNEIIKKKINVFQNYHNYLKKDLSIKFQKNEKFSINTYWAVGLIINSKKFFYKKIERFFRNKGIEVRNFFYPLNSQKIYRKFSTKQKYNTDQFVVKGITLPTFPSIKKDEISFIAKTLLNYLKKIR